MALEIKNMERVHKVKLDSGWIVVGKKLAAYVLLFIGIYVLLLGGLTLSALIPQRLLQGHMLESAEYICSRPEFFSVLNGVNSSKIDRYADAILLGIAWQYDSEYPLTSVMWSSYYHTDYNPESENLLMAVKDGLEANQQYLRYWHGSTMVVRLLMLIFNLKQIYVFHGILLGGLFVILLVLLIRERAYLPAAGICIGAIMTSGWFVPLSLEYYWTYMLAVLLSILTVLLCRRNRLDLMGYLLFAGGMVTNYLDFLTVETLTLLMPVLIALWWMTQKQKDGEACGFRLPKEEQDDSLRNGTFFRWILVWGFGYAGMWFAKWLTAGLVLQTDVFPYISEHIGERLGGDLGMSLGVYLVQAILRNLTCLLPWELGALGKIVMILLILAVIYLLYVYHREDCNKKSVIIYLMFAGIPYIRYMVLHNHSYLHYFFTYRAQMAVILALVLVIGELVDWRCLRREIVKRRRA